MLIIEGGRPCLYQWDVDQRLEVLSDEIIEVHFVNAVTSPALVCEVYEEDGRRFANVPNILLQQIWPVQAYGCCDCRVREVEVIKVVRREKPADYVYTETEVKTFSALEARIKELEEHGAGTPGLPGKTAYQYAQDGGYTGTEAEFAAKLAEEVYSKEETDAAISEATNEGKYELIDTITIDSGDTQRVTYSKEADGKAYNFEKMYAEVNVPNLNGALSLVFSCNGKSAFYASGNITSDVVFRIHYINRNGALTGDAMRFQRGDYANSSLFLSRYPAIMGVEAIEAINSFGVSGVSGAYIPQGIEIKIWGVRA